MSNELPPLPHPVTNALMGDDFEDLYTADQMREYGRARERAAYERAAQQCEIVRHNSPLTLSYQDGCSDCANAIRALGARNERPRTA